MAKIVFALAALVAVSASAQVTIPKDVMEQCLKDGGCIIVMPDGIVIPKPVFEAKLQEFQQQAYIAGAQTCKRKDV